MKAASGPQAQGGQGPLQSKTPTSGQVMLPYQSGSYIQRRLLDLESHSAWEKFS